jgi:high-affinity iron transporter
MFETLLICFREGLEAFLIVALILITLQKASLPKLATACYAAVFTAIMCSVALGVVLADLGSVSPVYEGSLALVAAGFVSWCALHMLKMGKQLASDITQRLNHLAAQHVVRAWLMIFGFVLFMVGREGVETATTIASLANNHELRHLAWGGVIGVVLATAISVAWIRYGQRVRIGDFFNATSWFMAVFAIQLLILAFHEFTEVAAIPLIDNAYWHIATESLAEGAIGQMISAALVITPTIWLAVRHFGAQRLPLMPR